MRPIHNESDYIRRSRAMQAICLSLTRLAVAIVANI